MAQKNKKKAKATPKLPQVKKELKDFMADDEGKMTRKDVTKLGVSLAVLGMMMQHGTNSNASDTTTQTTQHTNVVAADNPPDNCVTHTNVTQLVNNHYNHSDGSWMC